MAATDEKEVTGEIPNSVEIDWQLGKALGECMVEMYDRRLWTDVKFRCEDQEGGEFIQAHKLVLAARSPVFQAMFFGPCSQRNDEVDLKAVQRETLCLFLRYLYSDAITLTEEHALKILEMAHCYQVTSLIKKCADYLATVLSPFNVCRILTYAMQYDLADLRNSCCFFIDNHAEKVLKSDGFLNFSAECLPHILKGDTLYADETLILAACEEWARRKAIESGLEVNSKNTREGLGKSFYQLRLPTMTNKSLFEHVSKKGYLSVEEYADTAAFINDVPGVSVSSNSCEIRVPWFEEITVIRKDCSVKSCYLENVFEITARKDLALSSIVLCDIIPYVKFPNATEIRDRDRSFGVNLPNNLDFVLSVSIKTKSVNRSFDINLNQSQTNEIRFCPLLTLKALGSPHIVEMNVKYMYKSCLMMKTGTCRTNEEYKSVTGNIHVRSISGNFAAVETIRFANLSNRDVCTERDT